MKVYIGHSTGFDYVNDLYKPVEESDFYKKHNVILPHKESSEPFNSREGLKECDLMIAEVSFPSTGLGIELGWADLYNCDVICIYKKGAKISDSLKVISNTFHEYETDEELKNTLESLVKN